MTKKIYGAYGSNMNIPQMAQRCPNAKVIGTGHIKGYRLTFRASGVANIEPRNGMSVPVVLWEITEDCERALDRYEGFPSFYIKKDIKVKTAEGKTVTAMFYVMAAEYADSPAPPSRYYLSVIWDGYQQNNIPLRPLREALARNTDEITEKPRVAAGKGGGFVWMR